MDPNNEMPDFYEYYSQLDMNQYTQYCGYLEQLEDMEEDEAESSKKHSKRYIARERELAEEKLRRDYFGNENTPPVYPKEYFRRRVPGSNNDLNVLYGSPLFDDLLADKAPEVSFQVNGKTYEKGYYLADEIYPQWSTFVKAFSIARDPKTIKFKRVQESARRAFGVLQGRWGIIQQPARAYHINTIKRIMHCCMILHNMILEDQKFDISEYSHMYVPPKSNIQRTWVERCERQRRRNKELWDRRVHEDLRHDIVEHLWNLNNEI
ncbi:ALP1-like protein isoform X1 [Tanacetum coccineum]